MIDKTIPAAKATAPRHSSVAFASRPHITLRFAPRAQAISNRVQRKGRSIASAQPRGAAAYGRCAWPPLHARHA